MCIVNRIIAKVEKHAICVGEFVELRDPEEYLGEDPCEYVGVVVQVEDKFSENFMKKRSNRLFWDRFERFFMKFFVNRVLEVTQEP